YDGLGRPFIFACRTNGAAVWDQICSTHGVAPGSYQEREAALQSKTPDEQLVIWQPRIESFPVSPEIPVSRTPGTGDFASDYAGVIDSSLGILWYYTKDMSDSSEPLKVTGGPTASRAICERVASMWRRPVVRVGASGAAYGAALAAAAGLFRDEFPNDDPAERISALLQTGDTIQPDPELIRRYHTGGDAYVPRLIVAFSQRVQEL
ncbi:MAG: xylulose kinase, partial [Spirochaeta sp.]